ncbi:MAG: hypothetical protein CVV24_15600 [Ignavibacteriae bacterium HGW-Ignavibacteriae-3]|nr:MAG: hypothetical protein CVV24_15600 [Ignavibacteriae bacterium HGW-Ignavibacteriae-3]
MDDLLNGTQVIFQISLSSLMSFRGSPDVFQNRDQERLRNLIKLKDFSPGFAVIEMTNKLLLLKIVNNI